MIDTSNTRNFALIGGPMDGKSWAVTMERFFWPEVIHVNVPLRPDVALFVPWKDGDPVPPQADFSDFEAHHYELTRFHANVPNCLHIRTYVYVHSEHEMGESDVDAQLERWGLL